MSRFDPFDIYSHRQKYSHVGQILRKKPVKPQYAISGDMVKDAIKILEAVGLYNSTVISLPQPISDVFYFYGSSDDPYLINIQNGNPIPVQWSSLWPAIKSRFTSLLDATPTSFSLEIRLISFTLFGVIETGNDSSNSPNPYFYFNNPASALQIVQQTGTQTTSGRNGAFGIQALTNTACLTFYDFNSTNINLDYGGFLVRPKNEGRDTYALYSIETTDPAVLTALKNDDFTVFNPVIIYYYFTQSKYPIRISDNQITIQVSMSVN